MRSDPRSGRGDDVVLLSEHGAAIGSAPKGSVHGTLTPLHLAFSFYGFDRSGSFLASRRAASKSTWPGVWTNTCCGHPRPGEQLDAAVRRRVHEELDLEVARLWLALPQFRYRATMDNGVSEHEICPVFVGTLEGTPRLRPTEASDISWLDWDAYMADVASHPSAWSPWTTLQVPLLQASGFVELARRAGEALGGCA